MEDRYQWSLYIKTKPCEKDFFNLPDSCDFYNFVLHAHLFSLSLVTFLMTPRYFPQPVSCLDKAAIFDVLLLFKGPRVPAPSPIWPVILTAFALFQHLPFPFNSLWSLLRNLYIPCTALMPGQEFPEQGGIGGLPWPVWEDSLPSRLPWCVCAGKWNYQTMLS